jgi:hypothetical protein
MCGNVTHGLVVQILPFQDVALVDRQVVEDPLHQGGKVTTVHVCVGPKQVVHVERFQRRAHLGGILDERNSGLPAVDPAPAVDLGGRWRRST